MFIKIFLIKVKVFCCPIPEAAVISQVFYKKVLLKISHNSQEYTCVRISFLIKLQGSRLQLSKKGTLAQVFSCEFCEIFKNTFCGTPPVANSDVYQNLFSKVAGQQATVFNFIKKQVLGQVFIVNFAKFSRTTFSQNTGRLFLAFFWSLGFSFIFKCHWDPHYVFRTINKLHERILYLGLLTLGLLFRVWGLKTLSTNNRTGRVHIFKYFEYV